MQINKRIIMVEGCDRTGKSTFITYLKENLQKLNKIPIVFHLTGPTKYAGLNLSLDEKSLVQLAKSYDEYELVRSILASNENIIIIFDRTSFDEFVWSKYWNRSAKFTNYQNSTEFFKPNLDLFQQTIYIEYYISDIQLLANRISSFPEDKKIFTYNGKSVIENIKYVYELYTNLKDQIILPLNIPYESYDNIGTLENVNKYAQSLIKKYF